MINVFRKKSGSASQKVLSIRVKRKSQKLQSPQTRILHATIFTQLLGTPNNWQHLIKKTFCSKVNGLYLCFKVEVTARLSDAKRASAADKKRAAPAPPAQPSPSRSCAPRLVSPLEGLQFSLHECVSNGDASSRQKFKKSNIALQNQDEIVSKYFYGFETEEKALRKIHWINFPNPIPDWYILHDL